MSTKLKFINSGENINFDCVCHFRCRHGVADIALWTCCCKESLKNNSYETNSNLMSFLSKLIKLKINNLSINKMEFDQ